MLVTTLKVSEFFTSRFPSLSLGWVGRWVFHTIPYKRMGTHKARKVLDNLQPPDPLKWIPARLLPSIDVLIPATLKDFTHVGASVASTRQFSRNPIGTVRVVVPTAELSYAEKYQWEAEIISEERFLPRQLLRVAEEFHGIGKKGWALQVLIKIYGAWSNESRSTLVMDADTVLLRPRTWLSRRGVQLLNFSYEYHLPYENQAKLQWGLRKRDVNLSYVTHHMLLQPDLIRGLFPDVESVTQALTACHDSDCSFSEYHAYGRWVRDNFQRRTRIGRWRNIASSLEWSEQGDDQLKLLLQQFSTYLSVSSHSYLK